jgi:hypothetical protein
VVEVLGALWRKRCRLNGVCSVFGFSRWRIYGLFFVHIDIGCQLNCWSLWDAHHRHRRDQRLEILPKTKSMHAPIHGQR